MRRKIEVLFAVLIFGLTTAISIDAQRPYTASDSQVQYLLSRIETRTDTFKRAMNNALDASSLNNSNTEDSVFEYITQFENATDALNQKFASRQSVDADVEDVLTRAAFINQFMRNNRLTTAAQTNWNYVRTDLDTLARYYALSWNWTNPVVTTTTTTRSYRVTDAQVQGLLARIETRTDAFKRTINRALNRSTVNNTNTSDDVFTLIAQFESDTDRLKQRFDANQSVGTDVSQVLNRAAAIDAFMTNNRMTGGAQRDWNFVKTDLDTLASYYDVTWNWNNPVLNNNPINSNLPTGRFDRMFSGTYRLNQTQSDNVSEVVDRATSTGYQVNQRDRVRNNLERRLTSPDMLAIEKSGSQVTIASSTAPQVTFNADGVARTEVNPNGRSVKITATSNNDGVAISYEGERMNDFYVNFIPMSNGQLKVVRRLYLENRNDTVTVASVYDKVSPTAQWSQVTNGNVTTTGSLNNTFAIPNNTRMTAVLSTPVSTKTSQNGDRFQMEITSPSQYRGAIIEGRVARTERSGRVTGRAQVSLEFDTIRLRNGETYRFAGIVDAVTLASGEKVAVNNEGAVRDNSQTSKTVTRAGIGAALGALIGAIAGGGSGAAIGAGVGAGAGAGTVILQGRDDVELGNGTEFSITASAPANVSLNR